MTKIENLREKNAQIAGSMEALAAAVEARSEPMTTEEQTQFDNLDAQFKANEGEIARLERLDEIKAKQALPAPRSVMPLDGAQSSTGVPVAGATSHRPRHSTSLRVKLPAAPFWHE